MQRKTKIICTVGPAIDSEEMIGKMIDAGMNVGRLNFSHADHDEHLARIKMIRKVAKEKERFIGVMADTKGPEIRTGKFENGQASFKTGDIIEVHRKDILGNSKRFHIDCDELYDDMVAGNFILIDDGKIKLTVLDNKDGVMKCEVMNSGIIKTKKGVNVPNVKLSMPFVSKKDFDDIVFSANQNVDMFALSFVRRKEDVLEVRKILNDIGKGDIEIISKIENQEGVDNLEGILEVSDGVMVARGDLGVEVSTQLVPLYQKRIIKKANEMGKPVITATHMLESMMFSPRPTRAEASDVANAILDGSDAIMLSGESAAGEYPIEAVLTMDTIAKAIESSIPYKERLEHSIKTSQPTVNDAIGIAVSQTAQALPKAEVVIAFTESGGTAKRICKFRPSVPIIAITNSIETCQRLSYYWGVFAAYREDVSDYLLFDKVAIEVAMDYGFKSGTTLIMTSGWAQKHGSTNTMRIIDIP
ncbi:pyruvate kinase [Mariniplasma anaerobium]|uniref:Pyruvate kinase n=1 Tax=Mariniplasma anaerobium TaxID=2735436 RepID=A0A7U9XWA9_9MOLU|nr:pyruvate kinase [Mariniplasma anaerobium]BCR36503.1 pyruvate kinase [Mariniplasma anaerobium]